MEHEIKTTTIPSALSSRAIGGAGQWEGRAVGEGRAVAMMLPGAFGLCVVLAVALHADALIALCLGFAVCLALMARRLKAAKTELELFTGTMQDAVVRLDLSGRCAWASPATNAVLGVDPAGLVGNRMSDCMTEDAQERFRLAHQRLIDGETDLERFTYRRSKGADDGSAMFVEAKSQLSRHPRTGAPQAIIVTARNVTQRVELEFAVACANQRAEDAEFAKSEFLARVSQEIRAPMSAILGMSELMLDGDISPDHQRQVRIIGDAGRSIMLLLSDIHDLSRIEMGDIAVDYAPVDLMTVIEDCAAIHRPIAEQKGLALECDFEPLGYASLGDDRSASFWVLTDEVRLKQIILNLIGNAVRFTRAGHVRVSCMIAEHQFCIEVSDTGAGIAPARLETIFHPFAQAEGEHTQERNGARLGLPISHQLAQLLGGTIEVESTLGKGSRFTVTLPGTRVDVHDLPRPWPKSGFDSGPRRDDSTGHGLVGESNRARILVAAADETIRTGLSEMLEHCGQSVEAAHDGNEAIAMVFDAAMRGRAFDLVLMDLTMPECDGYAAARTIRHEGIGPEHMPIIAMADGDAARSLAKAREAGMQAQIAKLPTLADLAKVLQRWLPTHIVEISNDDDAELNRAAS